MKRIDLTPIRAEEIKGNEVSGVADEVAKTLEAWLTNAPDDDGRGQGTSLMRKRFKVVDKLDEATAASQDYVDLEDAQHDILKAACTNARFQQGNRTMLAIEDRVTNAKTPPKSQPVVGKPVDTPA